MIETALVELIDSVTAECVGQHRVDLHNRLRQIRTRVLDPAQLLLVVGESKQGKSALINAVVNAPVCAAGDDVSTVVPTLVRYSEEPSAQLIEQEPAHGPPVPDRRPVPIEQVREQIGQAVSVGRPVTRSEVGIPREVLKNGLVLMDTPGVGNVSSSLTATTLGVVTEADALLMVSDATQELTANEISFLKQVTALCPNVALVQPKTDITPHWRQVVEINRKHLSNAGISAKIFPVSSTVRMHAMSARDAELNTESGFPPLLEYLHNEMAGKHQQLARRLVAHNVADAIDQLTETLRAELTAQNPRTAAETLVELETAQRRAEDLRRISSRWQKTLTDGIQEMFADVEFDIRERTWAVLHQVNNTFDETDPNLVWSDFVDWLDDNLAYAIKDTFDWLGDRSERLARLVADHLLREHGDVLPELAEIEAPEVFDTVPEPKAPTGDYRRIDQVVTSLRGSYGGVLMFGLVTSMAGLPLLNVVSISAGLLLGSRSFNEEKDSRLKRRQTEAKTAAQRYVDHMVFQVNKEAKDAIRDIHRSLHSHFTRITEDAQEEVSRSINSIKRSAERSALDRDQRAKEIRKKLEDLAVLRKRASLLSQNRITAA